MQENQLSDKLPAEIIRGGLLIQYENSFVDQANTLESEGIMDQMYALLANGTPIGVMANALAMTTDRLKNILKSSPTRMKRYKASRLSRLADKSLDTLDHFSNATFMLKEESAAARHHLGIVNTASNVLGREEVETGNSIVVNTQMNFGVGMETPPVPDDLKGVIDVTTVKKEK